MEESPLEAQKREETLRIYHACKEALRIINDANMITSTGEVSAGAINHLGGGGHDYR